MALNYEIADMCKKCMKAHIKKKGSFKVSCTPVPKELENGKLFPLDAFLSKEEMNSLSEEDKLDLQIQNNKLLWAEQFLGWTPYNPKRSFYQYYQKEILLCTAKNKVERLGRRLGKCVEKNTLIATSNRGLVPAYKLKDTDLLITYDEKTKRIYPTRNWGMIENGFRECIKIVTESGREDTVTTNHPYLIKGEWIEAQNLKIGDKVTVPVDFSNIKYRNITDDNYEIYKALGKIAGKEQNFNSHIFRLSKNNTIFFLEGVLETKVFTNKFFVQTIGFLLQKTNNRYKIVEFNPNYFKIEVDGTFRNKFYNEEKIKHIYKVGFRDTVSISVQKTHTFLTNGIITHNTEGMCVDILHYACLNPNKKIVVVANSLKLITEIFDRIEALLSSKTSAYKNDYKRKRSPSEKVTLWNGTAINGFTTATDGNSIRGQSADKVFIDEGAYIPEQAYQVLMAFKLDNQNVSFTVASTPSALESNFRNWCMTDDKWKEFHFPSSILPNFAVNDEPELRSSLTEEGYKLEVEAEFSEGSSKVFKTEDIKESLRNYNYVYSRSELINPEKWKIAIGCDYNDWKNGGQVCVLGLYCGNPLDVEKPLKILHFSSINKFSTDGTIKDVQSETVNTIINLQRDFNADFVYCDEGHGSMQNEILSKHFFEEGKIDIFKGVNFASNYSYEDIWTGTTIPKRMKIMLVNFIQKRFEKKEIIVSEPEETGKNQLIEQLKEYRIDRYDNKDQPVFAGIDHKLDALMLANFALIENLDSIFDRATGNFILSFKNEGYKIDAGTFNNEYNTPNKKPYNGPLSINLGRMGVANGGKERNLKKAKKTIRSLSNGFFD